VTTHGPCPSEQHIAAFVEGTLVAEHRAVFESHLDACASCFDLVASLGRLVGQPAPAVSDALRSAVLAPARHASERRYVLPALAAAAVVLLAVSWWGRPATSSGGSVPAPGVAPATAPETPLERAAPGGARVRLEAPPDGASISGGFDITWTGPTEAVSYEVQVATAAGDVLWSRQVEGEQRTLHVDEALPSRRVCYLWVAAYLPEGRRITSNIVKIQAVSEP
jgi:anti-sigma factor RsiW